MAQCYGGYHCFHSAPADYTPVINQVVTFAAGTTNTTVQIQSLLDSTAEPLEKFLCVLSSQSAGVTIGNGTATVSIQGEWL